VRGGAGAATLVPEPLRRGAVTARDLAAVQKQREFAVRVVQWTQRVIQDRIAAPGLNAGHEFRPPWWLWLLTAIPGLRDIPARMLAGRPGRVRLREPPPALPNRRT